MDGGSISKAGNPPNNNSEGDPPRSSRVLLLESDVGLRNIITVTLIQQGVDVFAVQDPKTAREQLIEKTPDLFILELDHPAGSNGELIDIYRQKSQAPNPVLLMTTQRPNDVWRNRYKPDFVIYKPFDIRFLAKCVRDLIQMKETSFTDIHKEDYAKFA